MALSLEHTCTACGARIVVRGGRAFTPLPCPACGEKFRARSEIGGYRLGEILARSGLSVTFRAHDQGGAELAVKVLQPPYCSEPMDVEYFSSEVWAIARLNHPHIARIFATGVDHGLAWIAMEWLAHGSLAQRLATRGKLREAEVLALGLQAAGALGAAQAAGHLHHDLAPENLVFADARTVKVTDFGQAALYRLSGHDLGTLWGRTPYLAPERMRGEPEEAHSDIYALGAVLYHALTGAPPHSEAGTPLATLEAIEAGDVRLETVIPGLHERTAQLLNRMLAGEPSQRWQDWGEVVTQFSQVGALVARRDAGGAKPEPAPRAKAAARRRRASPAPRPLRWLLAFAAIIVVLSSVAVMLVWNRQPMRPRTASAHSPPPSASTPLPATPMPAATPATPSPAPPKKDWPGWQHAALGRGTGTVETLSTTALRLTAAGEGIRATAEDAASCTRKAEGHWTLIAKIDASAASAGLTAREAGEEKPALAVWITPASALASAVRKTAGAPLELAAPVAAEKRRWLRLRRRSALLTAEISADGRQWKPVARLENAALPASLSVGFVAWSGAKTTTARAGFDAVEWKTP